MLSSAYLDASEGSVEVDMSTTADLPLQRRSDSNIVAARPVIATVGRSTELEAMSSVLAEVLDRRSIAAVITGEPGIGKTRLVETMTETAEANGVAVAWARCVEGEQDAMWPWSQLILDLLDNELVGRPSSERWTGLEPLRALGPSVVAALGLPPISEVASSSAFEQPKSGDLLLAMTLLLHHVARTTPLTLVFDDVHWADPQTIRMLRFAARSLANLPIAFVVTWSLHEIRDGATVASELRSLSRLPSLVRVDLEGLDTGAVQQLAEKSGHRFSVCQADDLRQRSAGNPLYALELLNAVGADGALESVEIGQCPKLVDAVINRVDFVDLRARRLLSVASLFRTSFSASQLATVCGFTVRDTEDILNATVRGALVDEVDSACGQYRFRCPLVAEVVQDGLLAGERIGFHRAIGQHLLSLEGPSYEVAYHLVAGRRREDQILAAEIALEIFEQRPDYGSVVDVDPIVEQLLVAERSGGEPDLPPKLDIAVHLYLSWRAWLDRRCEDWATANSRALRGALELFSKDGVGDGSPADSAALARLARSATARVGVPVYYPGPVAEPYVEQATANDVAVLEGVSAALPVDQPSHWVVEIQLAHLRERDTKPTAAATMRGVREAKQALKKAEEKIDSDHIPVVRSMLLNRFGDRLSSEEQLQIVDHLRSTERSLVCDLFATRWAYPALMALGRRAEADERIQSAWNRARTTGDQVQVAEARAVRITHLLWTGQLDEAESQILRGIADWRKIGGRGLAAFGNQLYQVRRMKGDDVDPGGKIVKQLPRREHSLRPVRTAMVLADTGYHDRAFEHLDSAVEAISGRITPTADLAELAMAAALLDHADAGRLACTRLAGRSNRLLTNDTQGGSDVPGDRLIVSVDRFSVFGPASYFAGLGAAASGQRARATELIAAAVGLVKTSGGSLCGMRNLLSPFRDRLDFSEIGLDQ